MQLNVDLIILDLDGVVIDSAADITTAVNHARKLLDLPALSTVNIINNIGDGVRALIERSFPDQTPALVETALALYREYYRAHLLDATRLYPHVKTTLQVLHQAGKRIALVTNKSEPLADLILNGLGVRDYFDLIVGPESVQRMKPDPQGINKVLDHLCIPSRQAVMVGDTHTDIEAGQRAGVWTCAARYGLGDQGKLLQSQPDLIIDDLGQLLTLLK